MFDRRFITHRKGSFCLYQFYETPFKSSSFLSLGSVLTSICQRSYLAENLYFDSITVSSFMGGGETFCPVFETILNSSTALIQNSTHTSPLNCLLLSILKGVQQEKSVSCLKHYYHQIFPVVLFLESHFLRAS